MSDEKGFESIAKAWEAVFEDVVGIGSRITDIYKAAYAAEDSQSETPVDTEERRDRMGEVSNTIERSLRAARETFDEVTSRATASERPRELTREIEDAVAVSLRELGGALQRLSEQIASHGTDAGRAASDVPTPDVDAQDLPDPSEHD
ncbi:MAG: hypothetical protein DYH08_17610 [Actinobacteria bacterium ATB1]|nr:hypothetical protein [Actinobacteria bacterium ATB1]